MKKSNINYGLLTKSLLSISVNGPRVAFFAVCRFVKRSNTLQLIAESNGRNAEKEAVIKVNGPFILTSKKTVYTSVKMKNYSQIWTITNDVLHNLFPHLFG